jgi:hypothetical protein
MTLAALTEYPCLHVMETHNVRVHRIVTFPFVLGCSF